MDFVEQWKAKREAAYARPRVKCRACMTVDCVDWQDEPPICADCERSSEMLAAAEAKERVAIAIRNSWWVENGLAHNRHNTLETFDVLPSNKTAFEAVKASVGASKGVFLRGEKGCGKTHLMYGLIHELHNAGEAVSFIRLDDLIYDLRCTHGQSDLLLILKEADNLILDDFTFSKGLPSDFIYQPLNSLLDYRWQRQLKTWFTSNAGSDSITITEALGPRASSRIEGLCGRPVDIAGPDRRRVKV